ncbi:MAG: hypothetical protein RLY14_644 [Planctomycetota bacterium]
MNLKEVSDNIKKLDFGIKKNHVSSDLAQIKNGLYLMLLENPKDMDIKDKNTNKKTGEIGKVVVPENSNAIKFGKFENGLIDRMSGYSKHLHYPDDLGRNIFQRVLTVCYCLDLTSLSANAPGFNPAAIYEPFWNKSLEFYFSKNELLRKNQNTRSEYRVMNQIGPINRDNFISIQFLESIKQSIDDSFLLFIRHFKKEP